MAFLPGLFSALAPMLPGIVSTIGDIAGKVFNRAPGKGVGEALLEAAPSALGAVSGLASSLAPGLGGTAGNVLGTVGKIAGALAPAPSDATMLRDKYDKYRSEWRSRPVWAWAREAFNYPDRLEDKLYETNNKYFQEIMDAPSAEARDEVLARYMSSEGPQWQDPPKIPYGSAPASINASDHMMIRHGPETQPSHVAMAASGPMALQGVSPAQAYQNDSTQSMSPKVPTGMERYMLPESGYERQVRHSISPAALVNYRGERVPIQRTQAESHGSSPSFNLFDRLAPRPVEEQKAVAETMPPALDASKNDTNDLLKQAIGLLGRREVKKAAKKQKKKAKKGRK
jgi:hypothetical protein